MHRASLDHLDRARENLQMTCELNSRVGGICVLQMHPGRKIASAKRARRPRMGDNHVITASDQHWGRLHGDRYD